ncbi:hypothetical protein F5Y14DRAFT_459113 [Nemania sp. NC0429]|nr:hypothetical protein F5Y14DRAFT_459113 [Nemania sp. NC0429]
MSEQLAEGVNSNAATSTKDTISNLGFGCVRLLESKIAQLEEELESEQDETEATATKPEAQTEPVDDGSRYRMILSEWDPRTGAFKESTLPSLKDGVPEKQTKSNRAFIFRKITGVTRATKLLGRITSKWGWPEQVTRCGSPYVPLIYAWEEALREANGINSHESDDERQARDDLKELLEIISTSSGDVRLDRYFENRQAFLKERTIRHDALWTLFPPGSLIVGRPCHDEQQVFVVDTCSAFAPSDGPFQVVCFSCDWTGSEFSRVPFMIEIPGWDGDSKSVTDLPFYPLDFYEEDGLPPKESQARLKERLIERGKNYVKFCTAGKGEQMFNYLDGEAYFHRDGAFLQHRGSDLSADPGYQRRGSISSDDDEDITVNLGASWKPIEGAVIVDFASYLAYQPATSPILGPLQRYEGPLVQLSPERRTKRVFKDMYRLEWDKHSPSKDLSPEQLLCCPPRLLGYAPKRKTWAQLLVSHIKAPDKSNAGTFRNKLQLDDDAKDLIANSVMAHSESRKREGGASSKGLDDFAPEKGRGLVIMLYGVAQLAGKPLFSVGVSDIGIEGEKVERNLEKIFALAGLWEAVLLFDEADVFLESRGDGDNDLRRNAMVSVLLRVLEYYDGILILTTNRMKSLDIAAQSRIHLAIRFTDLTPQQKINIFNSFLEQLANKGLIEDLSDLTKWVEKDGKKFEFNGRQIRNIISTALGIAHADKRKLNRDDLISVARQTDDFKRHLATQEAIYRDRQTNQRN